MEVALPKVKTAVERRIRRYASGCFRLNRRNCQPFNDQLVVPREPECRSTDTASRIEQSHPRFQVERLGYIAQELLGGLRTAALEDRPEALEIGCRHSLVIVAHFSRGLSGADAVGLTHGG